jgi:Cu-Zn family superoxide dismutase
VQSLSIQEVVMKRTIVFATLALFLLGGAALAGEEPTFAWAKLRNADGNIVGFVNITEGELVSLVYGISGLPPGTHAFHIHGTGACEPPFKSAGGHFNPHGKKHGLKDPAGPHAGDMANIVVGTDGTASGVRFAPLVTLKGGRNSLLKKGGTAIVIHEGPDDYSSDPAGAAGKRIACGVIKKSHDKPHK